MNRNGYSARMKMPTGTLVHLVLFGMYVSLFSVCIMGKKVWEMSPKLNICFGFIWYFHS